MLVIRIERLRRNWPLRKVADRTGIAIADVSRVERGLLPPWPGWRSRLAAAFDLPQAYLFAPVAEPLPNSIERVA